MSIFRRQQLHELQHFFDHTRLPFREPGGRFGALSPKVDLREGKEAYEISLELPGLKKDDIHISLQKGVLTVEAQSSDKKTEVTDSKIIRQERHYGKYVRSFELNPDIHESDITAGYQDGILEINIPKTPKEDLHVTKININ